MTEVSDILRLMNWLSPVFPTGSFAYSSGLEAAVAEGLISDEASLHDWLSTLLIHGFPRTDAIFLTAGWHAYHDPEQIREQAELSTALAGSAGRHLETIAQGEAFSMATNFWSGTNRPTLPNICPLSIAVGAMAGSAELDLRATLTAYTQSLVTNQLQAAIRLSVLGQNGAVRLLAMLEPNILALVENAANSTLDDLGSATIIADIMSMRHEAKNGRMFRT